MFEIFGWSYVVGLVRELPKEVTLTGIAALTFLEIHRRESNVRIAKAGAQAREAELKLEELKAERERQKNESTETP